MKRPLAWFVVVFVMILFLLQIWSGTLSAKSPVMVSDSGEKSLSGYVQGDQIMVYGTVKDYSYNNQFGQISTELILKNIQILPNNMEDSNENNEKILFTDLRYSNDNFQYKNVLQSDKTDVHNSSIISEYGQSVYAYLNEGKKLNIGSKVILKGELSFWPAATNPGEFDAEKYYANRDAVFAVKKAKLLKISADYNPILQKLKELRMRQEELLEKYLPIGNAAIMKAMLFGNKKEIEEEIKDLYQNNGIAHILAISGLHISLLGMTVYRILQRLPLPKWLPLFISECFLLLYGCMVGISASAFRAIFMFTLFLFSKLLKRSYDMITAMAFSALLWLTIHPRYIFDCGFQLSYGAIIGIGVLLPVLQTITDTISNKWIRKGIALFLPSLSVTLITAPILIYNYYELSFFSIALNLIVLPLMAPLLLSGMMMLVLADIWTLPAKVFAQPINLILWIYELGCRLLEFLPIGRKNIAPLPIWLLILYYVLLLAMTILVKIKKHPYQFVFAITSIFILVLPRKPDFSVWILDVGQGDCNVIFTEEGHCFVIDCGSTSKRDVGEKILIPFLKYHGISQVDGVILSHPDADHMNGVSNLLDQGKDENINISYVYIYENGIENEREEWEEILFLAQERNIPVAGIGQGDILQTDSLAMECIYPLDSQKGLTGNEASLVMKVECGDFHGLFTGDLEAAGENQLIGEYGNNSLFLEESCDLLKVGHHGSSGSSSEMFLQWVDPKYTVISCGEDNIYGHPHEETMERLEKNEISYLITYEEGAVCFGNKKSK